MFKFDFFLMTYDRHVATDIDKQKKNTFNESDATVQ